MLVVLCTMSVDSGTLWDATHFIELWWRFKGKGPQKFVMYFPHENVIPLYAIRTD